MLGHVDGDVILHIFNMTWLPPCSAANQSPLFSIMKKYRPLSFLGFVALLPASLAAQTIWTGATDNNWANGDNWDTTAVPSSIDSVIIKDSGAAVITGFDAEALDVSLGDGSPGTLTVGALGTLTLTASLHIGCGCAAGTFTVESGGMGSSTFVNVDGTSTFTVTGTGSTWTASDEVATYGAGASIYVQNSGVLNTDTLVLGHDDDGDSLTAASGTLTIDTGGIVATTSATIGYAEGATGSAIVTGAGSQWNTGSLTIGQFGQGDLTISDGGVINSTDVDLAYGNTSGPGTTTGTVTVTGTDSRWNVSGTLSIGGYVDETLYNSGTLTIADGAVVKVGADDGFGNGTGTVRVDTNGALKIGNGALAGTLNAAEVALSPLPLGADSSATPASLTFNHTDNITFAPIISGEGVVTKLGSGTTTLTANSTYTGLTVVSGGTLVLDNTGSWASESFEITGSNSTLRVGSNSTLAADLTVVDGTVEIAGVLGINPSYSVFTDGTLKVLSGGDVSGDFILNGASSLILNAGGTITAGITLNDTSTLDTSAADMGSILYTGLEYTGTRDVTLPAPGIMIGGAITLAGNVTTDLNQAGLIAGNLDIDGFVENQVFLFLDDNAHATISAAQAVHTTAVTLLGDSTLSINATGGLTNSLLNIYDDAKVTLGAANALSDSGVYLSDNGTLALNGYDATLIDVSASGGRIENGASEAATLTLDLADCGCGGYYEFDGVLADGGTGALGLNVTGSGTLYLVGPQTYTGPTRVTGATLFVAGDPVNGGILNSTITVAGGGTLAGTGPVATVVMETGGILSPGDFDSLTGTLATGDITITGTATFEFDLANTVGTPGIDWDQIAVDGNLTFDTSLLTIELYSGDGISTTVANFDPTQNYSWNVAHASDGITNFDLSSISFDSSGFEGDTGTWSLTLGGSGKDLILNYAAPIPEPSSYAVFAGLGVLGLAAVRRQRRPGVA